MPTRGPASKRHRKYGQCIADAWPWILERVRSGIPIKHATEAAGFCKASIYEYMRDPDAREEMDQAKAEGEEWLVLGLYEAARQRPEFGLLLLERRRPDEWGRQDKIELTGKDGGPVATVSMTKAEALAELRELAARSPEVAAALKGISE